MQYFLIENGISKNTIDNLSFDKYKKMCQKFYKSNSIHVDNDMFQKFKHFVKTEPWLQNENMKYLITDTYKYFGGEFYANNTTEIMANHFAIKELVSFAKIIELSGEQYMKLQQCLEQDSLRVNEINPETKQLQLVKQNLIASPLQHIRHLYALSNAKISPFIKNSETFMDSLFETISKCIDINNETNCDNEREAHVDTIEKEVYEASIADDVLDDITFPNITTPRDENNIEK